MKRPGATMWPAVAGLTGAVLAMTVQTGVAAAAQTPSAFTRNTIAASSTGSALQENAVTLTSPAADMVVDSAKGYIFTSGGQSGTGVEVYTLTGRHVTSVNLPGAWGMALSPDGATLYVAQYGGGQIVVIDVSTRLTTATIPLTEALPRSLAYTDGTLWYSAAAESNGVVTGLAQLGGINPATNTVSPSATMSLLYDGGTISASPNNPNVVLASDTDEEPSTVYVFNVSSGKLVQQTESAAWGADPCTFPQAAAVDPNGTDLIPDCGTGVRYTLATYAVDGSYGAGASAIATSSDEVLFGGGNSTGATISVYAADTSTPLTTYSDKFAAPGSAAMTQVAFGADDNHLYGLQRSAGYGGATQLDIWAPRTSETVRVAGSNAIGTAIAASQQNWADNGNAANDPGGRGQAQAVVLSRSDQFYDALAGSALAVDKGGPLLITPPTALNANVLTEIKRILPTTGTVYLLGGTAAISPAVQTALTNAGYTNIVRLAGGNEYETAVAIDHAITDYGTASAVQPTDAIVATGNSFYDALSAGAAAGYWSKYGYKTVVVLTNDTTMPAASAAYLNTMTPNTSSGSANGTVVVTAGGPGDSAFRSAVQNNAMPSWAGDTIYYRALVGANAPDTALDVAKAFFGKPYVAAVATSASWYDALTGGAMIGTDNGPLLLTAPTSLNPDVAAYFTTQAQSNLDVVAIMGGTAALPASIVTQIDATLQGTVTNHVVHRQASVSSASQKATIGGLVTKLSGGSGSTQIVAK